MKRASACVTLVALVLAGCEVGPDYVTPDMAVPRKYSDLPMTAASAPISVPSASQADLSAWWTQFHDAELDSLIARAMAANLDLLTAASRVREARQQEIEAGAAALPKVDASAFAAHLHSNAGLESVLGGPPSGEGFDTKLYSLGFDATWEVDIFGGVRRSVEAAHDTREAALWDMRDGEVTLTAEIAADYLTLRALQAQIALLQDEAKRQTDTLVFIRARRRAGFVTELDVNQQVALEESTVAQIPLLEAQAGAVEHAIAVLMAEPPDAVVAELERSAARPVVPKTIPVGLPSVLLLRRPDVREAERKLASATANIGVAVSDLYPKFDLLGGVSLASTHLSSLFTSNALAEGGAGSITWPIFEGGQIRANIHAKTDEADQAYFAYKKTILTALQDVEDSLLRYEKDQPRLLALERAATSARSSSDIAYQQYRVGLTPYVNVLTAQANDLSAEVQLEQGREALTTDLVSLYKALGGGWSMPDPKLGPPPDRTKG
ncbi:MAG TPA: efflux transporter outer membrane subunit [Rhizomicrobium sp.]|nr:efflux transporter outer membrane subunit [Rhizomicrobium sp.]